MVAAVLRFAEGGAAMMYDYGYPAHWAGMIVGAIAMIVFSIAIIWAVAWTVASAMQRRDAPAPHASDALTILDRRYAAGELSDAEYAQRREVLRGNSEQ
jgi:uncharacterized membrane protein